MRTNLTIQGIELSIYIYIYIFLDNSIHGVQGGS